MQRQRPPKVARRRMPMEELETSGRTVDEAIDKAVRKLGVAREDVEVVVVD